MFKVVDDQYGMLLPVQIEFRLFPPDFDLERDPFVKSHIRVGLVFPWAFFPETVELEIRIGEVLRGAVSAQLIFCSSIGRADVDTFEPGIALVNSKGNANEPARKIRSILQEPAQNLYFDHSIFEIGSDEMRKGRFVNGGYLWIFCNSDRLFSIDYVRCYKGVDGMKV